MIYGEKFIHTCKIIKAGRLEEMPSVWRAQSRTHTPSVVWTYRFSPMDVYCARAHTTRITSVRTPLVNGRGGCLAPRHPFRDRLAVTEYVWHIQISPARSHRISWFNWSGGPAEKLRHRDQSGVFFCFFCYYQTQSFQSRYLQPNRPSTDFSSNSSQASDGN